MKKMLLSLCTILSLCVFAGAQTNPSNQILRPTKEQIRQAQKILQVSETGEINREYNTALKKYQTKNGMIDSGYLGRITIEKMGIALTSEQKEYLVNAPKNRKCPNFNALKNICLAVSEGQVDPNPISMRYQLAYQAHILEASCTDPETDSDEIINKKISSMFDSSNSALTCPFEIINGSLFKYGVVYSKKSDNLVYDIIKWRVNLNHPDPADDGRTLLDYVQKKLNEHKNNALGNVLQGYYDRLKAAGAKHKSEL